MVTSSSVPPVVSVILPVYNGEAHIHAALDSALRQTYRHIEVIVVDDGSRDRTRAIVEARAQDDARVRVVGQANRGVAAARNRALAEARGEFIAPLDADDLWDPTKLDRQVERLLGASEETGLVYCWWLRIDGQSLVLDCSPGWDEEGMVAERLLQVNFTGNSSVPLFRRAQLEAVGGYDETLRARGAQGCEDWDVALKIAERSRVVVVQRYLVGYRVRPESMSSQADQMWRSHALLLEGALRRRPSLTPALRRRSRSQFALYLSGVCFWARAYPSALYWGLRSLRSSLALHALPYLIALVPRMIRAAAGRRPVRPGVAFGSSVMPPTLIPYDLIHRRRAKYHRRMRPPSRG
jgi:glycosyltransferase involved in cell wall biosynthesis